jgi:hypothetical protein
MHVNVTARRYVGDRVGDHVGEDKEGRIQGGKSAYRSLTSAANPRTLATRICVRAALR